MILLLFAVGLGFSARTSTAAIGDPSNSRLSFLTDLFPPRRLQAADLTSVACFDRARSDFVVTANAACTVAVPSGVQQIRLAWPANPRITLVVTRPGDLTQTYHSDDPPQQADQPGRLDVPVTGSGSTAVFSCAAAAPCLVTLR